jgi:ABC-type transport system involved in multi-copper enzyme maturation permease subunit
MVSKTLVGYVLTAALRDKLIMTLLLMIVMGAGLSVFLGSSGMTEQESFAIVFGSGGLRFLSVVGLVIFVCFYMRRSFETREVEFLLSRPISRMKFLLSHTVSFIILALVISAVVTLVVGFLGKPDTQGLLIWGASVAVENTIMIVAGLFFSIVLSSAAGSALATLGFYVLARLIGTLIGIAAVPADKPMFLLLNHVMDLISIIVPRLDMMCQTSWLVYGVEGASGIGFLERAGDYSHFLMNTLGAGGFVLVQGVVFVALLIAASAFDFSRRQF